MGPRNEYPKEAGVYKLTSTGSNKIYIGKAVNLYLRLNQHKNSENRKGIKGYYIQNAIKKHGWSSFTVEILEIFEVFDKTKDNKKLLERESYYIELFDSTNVNKGYNICKYSTDRTGLTVSEETRRKISLASLGKPKSKEAIEKMRKTKTGVPHKGHSPEALVKMRQSKLGKSRPEFSEEWKQNIGKGHLGMILSEETKLKMSQSSLGKHKSEKHVENMRLANLGKTHSEETKQKMSRSQLGRVHTEETKEKLRQVNVGRKMSLEARENMRKSRLAYIEKQKLLIGER